jgi:hypothetical protein
MSTTALIIAVSAFFACITPVFAQEPSPTLSNFVTDTLQLITLIATTAATLFLIKGGYEYLTSSGKPETLDSAKRTIKNSLLGLVLVFSARILISIFDQSLNGSPDSTSVAELNLAPLEAIQPSEGLTQVLIDAVTAFMRNIIESATTPIVEGIIRFLTTTPTLLGNSVILNFWLVSLGIVNALFVLVVALLGLQLMSATTFGFEEATLKQLLPRIGLGFLGANLSLFLADYAIVTSNALVSIMLDSTGGLNHAWIVNAVSPSQLITGGTPLITLIFLIIFLIISIVLLLMYISRLILISLSAVLAPFIFLLWTIPKFSDFAEIATKTYLVTVFMVFVHVVIIQLASAFLTLPEHTENSLVSIAVAIGLFFTLAKTPSMLMQMTYYTSGNGMFKKLGSQLINVLSTHSSPGRYAAAPATKAHRVVRAPRKVIS